MVDNRFGLKIVLAIFLVKVLFTEEFHFEVLAVFPLTGKDRSIDDNLGVILGEFHKALLCGFSG